MKAYCIYGPPGTGKTTELVRLINATLERNPGARAAFLSHTRVAAREAVKRGHCKIPVDDAMTLHSLCFRIGNLSRQQVVTTDRLVKFGEEIGVPISGATPDSERELTDGDFMMAIYDLARARMWTPERGYDESEERPGTPAEYMYLIRSYESWKQNLGLLDFTDMLSNALQYRGELPYRAFFIDEAQDLSTLQRSVLYHLIQHAALVFMAGDDDQAIFEWAGADPRGMPEFEARFDAERKVLGQSHRVPRSVHELAGRVIGRVGARVPKTYLPRAEEGTLETVGDLAYIECDHPMTWLYRDRSVRADMEEQLQNRLVPYTTTVGFPSPLQSKAGRAVQMLLRIFAGERVPREEARGLEDRLTDRGKLVYNMGQSDGGFMSDYVNIPYRHVFYLDNVDVSAPHVVLSSIHSYKGAEADHVVLSNGMSQRTHANLSKKPDEEHRIFYVGVTRARQHLTIVTGDNSYDL